jgi:DNA (cytosine-5)-methyltransferase 1
MNKKGSAVDLFCGAGGLTKGLENAGINVSAGIDLDDSCRYAYEENNDAEFIKADLSTVVTGEESEDSITPEEIEGLFDGEPRILVGCAPCQPFSDLNNGKASKVHDKYGLLKSFAVLVEKIRPEIVMMENVPGVRKTDVFKDFVSSLKRVYGEGGVWWDTVDTEDFGVPQRRKRLVLTASDQGKLPLVQSEKVEEPVTVKEHISKYDLEEIEAGEQSDDDKLHQAAGLSSTNLERIKQSSPGGTWEEWDDELKLKCHKKSSGKSFCSSYGRMDPHEPSPTITTQFYNYGSGRFGHYDYNENNPEQGTNRAISLREGALLQTFPPDYQFFPQEGSITKKEAGMLIGNAVPVRLAEAIGSSIVSNYSL